MTQKVYIIENVDCANCAAKIEAKIQAMQEVSEATLTFATKQLRVTAEDPDALVAQMQAIARTVEDEAEIFSQEEAAHRSKAHHEHHEHHHHHDGDCCCGHDHHHHHHADEVFTSWGTETAHKFTEDGLRASLASLDDPNTCGMILRAKGIVPLTDGTWAHFDYVPGEVNVRRGTSEITGKICVIGSKLDTDKIPGVFGI